MRIENRVSDMFTNYLTLFSNCKLAHTYIITNVIIIIIIIIIAVVSLTGVAPLGAVSHRFNLIF